MRWPTKVALVTCLARTVAIPFAVSPIIRAAAEGRAAERGLVLEVAHVSLGFGRVVLRDVHVKLKKRDGLDVTVDSIEVKPTWTLGVRSVAAHGGRVTLRGSVSDLKQALETTRRARRSGAESPADAGSAPRLSLDGIDVIWWPGQKLPAQHLWGLSASLMGDVVNLHFDLGRLAGPGFGIDVAKGRAQLGARGGGHPVRQIGAESVSAWVDLDQARPSRMLAGFVGDAQEGGELMAANPGTPSGTGADQNRGRQLRAVAGGVAASLERLVPEAGAFEFGGLVLEVRSAGQRLRLGPAALRLGREGDAIGVSLRPAADAATGLEVLLKLPLRDGPVDLTAAGGPVSLAALGVREGDFGLEAVQGARLEARTQVRLRPDGSAIEFDGTGNLRELTMHQARLSASTLRHINVGWSGRGTLHFDKPRLEIEAAQLELGAVRLELSGSAEKTDAYFAVDARARVPLASCQTMMQSAPEGLFPALRGLRLSGSFSVDASVAFDSRRPSDVLVHFGLDNRCVVTQAPEAVDPRRYYGAFTYQVQSETGAWLERQSGPGTNGWAELGNISKYMEAAVLVCEDGGFYRHHGFDRYAIQSAIRQNLEAGKFLRGASTISMQLAKNLYLGREKTLARKLQEAVFTMMLEQALSKEQILELYLNVIEYGPGLYGIGPASRFYFDKEPADLTLTQAFYLASLLPNPRHDHFDRNGALSTGWQSYLRRLMTIAEHRRLVTPEELEVAIRERLVFGRPTPLSDEATGGGVLNGGPLADPYEREPSGSSDAEGAGVRLVPPEDADRPLARPRRATTLRATGAASD